MKTSSNKISTAQVHYFSCPLKEDGTKLFAAEK